MRWGDELAQFGGYTIEKGQRKQLEKARNLGMVDYGKRVCCNCAGEGDELGHLRAEIASKWLVGAAADGSGYSGG